LPDKPTDNPTYESLRVAAGLKFADGLAWSRSGWLAIADGRQKKVLRLKAGDAGVSELMASEGGAAGVAFDAQARLYVCETGARRVTRTDLKGKSETLAESFEGRKLNGPNDVTVRRDGHAYFTDPAFGSAVERRALDFYGVFHVSPKGEVAAVARWQTRPGGLALTADGRTLYVADADRHAVVAFEVGRNGEVDKPRDVVTGVAGVPGGMRTDAEGRLYVAARGIAVYSAAGKLERTMIDSTDCTNCTFGGAELEYLFVSARADVYRIQAGVKGALQY